MAWKVLRDDVVFDGAPWLRVRRQRVRLPSGREVEPFYMVDKTDFAIVFARRDDGRILVREGYRHGPGRETLDLPAGHLDGAEDALETARRELREETGHEARAWRRLGTFTVDGNRGAGRCHVFLAEGAHAVAPPHEDDTEVAHLRFLTQDEVRAALREGRFATLAAGAGVAMALLGLEPPHGHTDTQTRST